MTPEMSFGEKRVMDHADAPGANQASTGATPEELALARLMVTALNLEMAPTEIEPQAPLYGEGLGLDSIDILELSLAISKQYGIKLRSDDENNTKIFSSLRSLSHHIQTHRPH